MGIRIYGCRFAAAGTSLAHGELKQNGELVLVSYRHTP